MSDDFIVDDIFGRPEKKKRPNSGRIGKTGERELGKLFSERFPNHPPFSRCLGSGARSRQVVLSKEALNLMEGDLVCPPLFNFTIECKLAYDDIEITQAIAEKNAKLDSFLEQASSSAKRTEKIPLLCWRKKRRPWIAFLPKELIKPPERYLIYNEWIGLWLEDLFKQPDQFFFNST